MQIESFLLAHSATDHGGKLCVLDAFDTVCSQNVPFNYPHAAVVLRLRVEQAEQGKHEVRILLIDEDGRQAGFEMKGDAHIRIDDGLDSAVTNLILQINGLPLPRYGTYHFDLVIDGQLRARLPLRFRPLPDQQRKAA